MKRTDMTRFWVSLLAVFVLTTSGDAEMIFDGGWRISVGAAYDSGVKSSFRFSPHSTYVAPAYMNTGRMKEQEAMERGWGTTKDGRTTYDNNGRKSWVEKDTHLSDPTYGERDRNRNVLESYRMNRDVYDGNGTFTLGHAEYERIDTTVASDRSLKSSDSDDAAMPGISAELARNIYYNEEYYFGLDIAFAFQYARRSNVFRHGAQFVTGSSQRKVGYYEQKATIADSGFVDFLNAFPEIWNNGALGQNEDGTGPTGEPITLDAPGHEEWNDGAPHVGYGSTSARADYENLEMMLLLRPYYDICEWLRINLEAGAVVSRQGLDFSVAIMQAEQGYWEKRDYNQWDVYGVAGGGLTLYYGDFSLSADFMARFFDDDMDVTGRYYSGSVERGDWMFRLMVGYGF